MYPYLMGYLMRERNFLNFQVKVITQGTGKTNSSCNSLLQDKFNHFFQFLYVCRKPTHITHVLMLLIISENLEQYLIFNIPDKIVLWLELPNDHL